MTEPKFHPEQTQDFITIGASAPYSGSKIDGRPQPIRLVAPLTEHWLGSPPGLHQARPVCVKAHTHRAHLSVEGLTVQLNRRVVSGQALPEPSPCGNKCDKPKEPDLNADYDSHHARGWEPLYKSEMALLPRNKQAHKIFSCKMKGDGAV